MEAVQQSRRPMRLFSNVDTTAFTSILAVLIVILLVVASISYNQHHGISVDMPRVLRPVAMKGALRGDAMRVSILRDGQVYFGSDIVWSGNLAQKIQDRLKDREVERKVYITADMRARWSVVEKVLGDVRSAGIIRVAFMADQGRLPKLSHH